MHVQNIKERILQHNINSLNVHFVKFQSDNNYYYLENVREMNFDLAK